jgi:hypothetical protein
MATQQRLCLGHVGDNTGRANHGVHQARRCVDTDVGYSSALLRRRPPKNRTCESPLIRLTPLVSTVFGTEHQCESVAVRRRAK